MVQDEVNRIKRQGPGMADMDMESRTYREIPAEVIRNGYITQAYTDLAADMPENHWVRLASYVSVQGGCAIRQAASADDMIPDRIFGGADTGANMLTALGEANVAIFESIYPPMRMAANCGIERVLECADEGAIQLEQDLRTALEQMQDGDLRGAADTIARYEQMEVVQPVYERWPGTFQAAGVVDGLNVFQDMTSIPVAKTCTRENLVPLGDRSIASPTDRVDYYRDLMDRMYEIEGIRE
ncbi:hypothetical protein RA29_17505 [Tateyamaria sp. ANG-S1]|nr:hypothetical protein RA29_17505 [Tateyamaria sp. ANG-S1]